MSDQNDKAAAAVVCFCLCLLVILPKNINVPPMLNDDGRIIDGTLLAIAKLASQLLIVANAMPLLRTFTGNISEGRIQPMGLNKKN